MVCGDMETKTVMARYSVWNSFVIIYFSHAASLTATCLGEECVRDKQLAGRNEGREINEKIVQI